MTSLFKNITNNTLLRWISGLSLVLGILVTLSIGPFATLIVVGVLGFLITDEITTNFYKINRGSTAYIFQVIFYILFLLFFSAEQFAFWNSLLGIIFNSVLILSLISPMVVRTSKNWKYFIAPYSAIFCNVIIYLSQQNQWWVHIIFFISISAITDIMAWFWGRSCGRRKLWQSVSPGKTIEGAIGGTLTCTIICFSVLCYLQESVNIIYLPLILSMTIMAVLGDLAQSNLKRKFQLKDSSSLIPGHGGVYDRLDSHFFVAPVYQYLVIWGVLIFS